MRKDGALTDAEVGLILTSMTIGIEVGMLESVLRRRGQVTIPKRFVIGLE
jgi:hypothetical protein